MCTSITKNPYRVKIFYRKPRYTHYCSVWNIILSSLYQKCMIWAVNRDECFSIIREVFARRESCDTQESTFKTYRNQKSTKSHRHPLNWGRKRHWSSTWSPNRWPTWRATGINRTATRRHRIRWNSRGENCKSDEAVHAGRVFGLNRVHSTGQRALNYKYSHIFILLSCSATRAARAQTRDFIFKIYFKPFAAW